jgi:hypothetical protein
VISPGVVAGLENAQLVEALVPSACEISLGTRASRS